VQDLSSKQVSGFALQQLVKCQAELGTPLGPRGPGGRVELDGGPRRSEQSG
jgi:hypothetical protein